jgi:hypothetical protein
MSNGNGTAGGSRTIRCPAYAAVLERTWLTSGSKPRVENLLLHDSPLQRTHPNDSYSGKRAELVYPYDSSRDISCTLDRLWQHPPRQGRIRGVRQGKSS